MRVTVVALPAPAVFLTPKGLEHVGPRAFGYDIDFKIGLRRMRRIGIDVGGTNTDAVLLDGRRGRACGQDADHGRCHRRHRRGAGSACATTRGRARRASTRVVIGTTHFINAVVQRRSLTRVAAIRIGLPAGASLPPFCDWPADLAELRAGRRCSCSKAATITTAARSCRSTRPACGRPRAQIRDQGHARRSRSARCSRRSTRATRSAAREILAEECPGAAVTLSHRARPHRAAGARERGAAQCRAAPTSPRDTIAGFREAIAASGIDGAALPDPERRHRDVGRGGDGAAGHELCLGRDQLDARRGVSVRDRARRWSSMSAAPRPISASCAAAFRARPIRWSRSARCAPCSACPTCSRSGSAAAASSGEAPLAVGPQSVGYRLVEAGAGFRRRHRHRDRRRGCRRDRGDRRQAAADRPPDRRGGARPWRARKSRTRSTG